MKKKSLILVVNSVKTYRSVLQKEQKRRFISSSLPLCDKLFLTMLSCYLFLTFCKKVLSHRLLRYWHVILFKWSNTWRECCKHNYTEVIIQDCQTNTYPPFVLGFMFFNSTLTFKRSDFKILHLQLHSFYKTTEVNWGQGKFVQSWGNLIPYILIF